MISWRDMRPRFLQIGIRLPTCDDHSVLNRGEFAALDLRVPAFAAEVDIDQREHQLGIQNDESGAPQRIELDQVQARRQMQCANVIARTSIFDRPTEITAALSQHVVQTARSSRPNRSLIISSVGIRPRTMRTLLPRS